MRMLPLALAMLSGCAPLERPVTVGVSFETLQTEYWVASYETLKAELERRQIRVLTAVADGDPSRQLEQVQGFLIRRVDGIIIAPKDGATVLPIIKAANRAGVPIVLYNRPPASQRGQAVTVVADNFAIARDTVLQMCELARQAGRKHKGVILMGDLADLNGIARRDGFDAAVKECPDAVEVVGRIPTEWNQEKAFAGLDALLRAHPDIDFVFTSSDFLFPSIVSALSAAGKYQRVGEPGHVLLGGFDGDATAYRMLRDGYLDVDGVQDMQYECELAVDAVLKLRAGEPVERTLRDPGFVIQRGNLHESGERMWGAKLQSGDAPP
jgi:ABC-type sugar transport system substrate-binding protein